MNLYRADTSFHVLAALGWAAGAVVAGLLLVLLGAGIARRPSIGGVAGGAIVVLTLLYLTGGCCRRARKHVVLLRLSRA